MALQVQKLKRVFIYTKDKKEQNLADPNPSLTPQEVMKFYSGTYPELTNAIIEGPKVVKDKATYNIATKAGKLG